MSSMGQPQAEWFFSLVWPPQKGRRHLNRSDQVVHEKDSTVRHQERQHRFQVLTSAELVRLPTDGQPVHVHQDF